MTQQQLSIDAGLVTKASDHRPNARGFLPWAVLGCAVIVLVVLMADATITPEQRIDAFLQSGTFP
jgi:hypothetical protein